jgi:glycosyltransferase involved in cell wall biosynthesis
MLRAGKAGAGRLHVVILVQNLPVPFDRRVWQEALALVEAGYAVHVICPATKEHPLHRETLSGVRVYRYSPGPEARRSAAYLVEYPIAILAQLRIALRIRLRHRVRIVHICNPPDLLFLVALPLVALGSRLLFDHHDACPELVIAKGHKEGSWQVRLAKLSERLTYRFSHVSVETNESYRAIALSRGRMSGDDVFVVRSAPADSRFASARPEPKWRNGRKYLVGYVGVMGLQDGLDYLVDAARVIVSDWQRQDIQFMLVGSGPEFPRLRERVRSLGIADQVTFTGRLSDADLGAVLATADVCVNPDEANRMNDISTMNKVMEYMALGKPIVQFDLHEGRFSAGDSSLYAARNDATSLARCIVALIDDPGARARMGQAGQHRLTTALSWELQVPRLLAAYQRALGQPAARPADVEQVPALAVGPAGRTAARSRAAERSGAPDRPEASVPAGPGSRAADS